MDPITRKEFEASYLLWAAATAEHQSMMADAMAGKPIDVDLMHQQLAQVERLHEDWTMKSKGFVQWLKPQPIA